MSTSIRTLLRLTLPLLLGACLLLTQQISASHAVQHALTHQQEQSAPHTHHCDLCALDAQLGSTLHSTPAALLLASFSFVRPASPAAVWLPACLTRYSARGPPLAA